MMNSPENAKRQANIQKDIAAIRINREKQENLHRFFAYNTRRANRGLPVLSIPRALLAGVNWEDAAQPRHTVRLPPVEF